MRYYLRSEYSDTTNTPQFNGHRLVPLTIGRKKSDTEIFEEYEGKLSQHSSQRDNDLYPALPVPALKVSIYIIFLKKRTKWCTLVMAAVDENRHEPFLLGVTISSRGRTRDPCPLLDVHLQKRTCLMAVFNITAGGYLVVPLDLTFESRLCYTCPSIGGIRNWTTEPPFTFKSHSL